MSFQKKKPSIYPLFGRDYDWFRDIVFTQWAKSPNGENQPPEIRPMKEIQLYGVDSIPKGSGDEDFPWMFTTWVCAYPNDDDPWMSHPMNRNDRVMQSAMGIWTTLDDRFLFQIKEKMVKLDEAYIKEYKDDDGNVIRTVQEMGYRTVLPFISVFNKSVYDVIFREHQRLMKDVGESIYPKALLRFELWFKTEGITDHNKIDPFWSKAFIGTPRGTPPTVAINEPEREPPPLSDKDKWEDVLLELEMTESKGKMNLRVKHPNLAKGGVVLSLDNWQRKLRTMLYVIASMPSRLLNRETITDKLQLSDKKYAEKKSSVNKQDIHRLNNTLKYVIGITYDNPIQQMEKERGGARMMQQIGEHPVLPSIRLAKEFVSEQLNIDSDRDIEAMGQEDFDITDDANQEYSSQWLRCKPAWYKQN